MTFICVWHYLLSAVNSVLLTNAWITDGLTFYLHCMTCMEWTCKSKALRMLCTAYGHVLPSKLGYVSATDTTTNSIY